MKLVFYKVQACRNDREFWFLCLEMGNLVYFSKVFWLFLIYVITNMNSKRCNFMSSSETLWGALKMLRGMSHKATEGRLTAEMHPDNLLALFSVMYSVDLSVPPDTEHFEHFLGAAKQRLKLLWRKEERVPPLKAATFLTRKLYPASHLLAFPFCCLAAC